MKANVRTVDTRIAWLVTGCLMCLAAAATALAQLGSLPRPVQLDEPGLHLDVDALINDPHVFETSVAGPVWQLDAMPGRKLVQVPVIVKPGEVETELGMPTLKLRGGRFIAWRIVPDASDSGSQTTAAPGRGGGGYGGPMTISNRRDAIAGLTQPGQPIAVGADTQGAGTETDQAQPEDIPTLVREIQISPDGIMHWKLARAIPGAEVKSGESGYLLKLRPDRLADLEPKRESGRSTASRGNGRDPREAAAQRREQDAKFREEAQAFNELRKQVRELPDEFEAALPARLWAIYEVPDRMDTLSFTGEPPMPWQIAIADIETLKQAGSSGGGRSGELTAQDFALVSQMSVMIADGSPLTRRAVATALSRANLLGRSEQGDALYRLTDQLLKSGDPKTVQTVTAGLAASAPPSAATLSLLKGAFEQMDATSKLLALSGMLTVEENDPVSQRQLIDTANRIIDDPNGPGVVYVLDELVRALGDNQEAAQLIGNGIKFDGLSPEALDRAIIYCADAAGTSGLAAEWMDHGLLGSTDQRVVRRTVEMLGTSTPGGGMVTAITRSIVRATFGPAKTGMVKRGKPVLRGNVRIPITSTRHSIYRVLNAGDPELRAMGWKALRVFQIPPAGRGGYTGATQPGADDEPDRLGLILNAAFDQTVTPPQLVAFLVNQADKQPATAALVRVVVEGRGPAVTLAARALVGSGRQIDRAIQSLDVEQRGAFASRLYESVNGSAPMVAGLMRVNDARSQIVTWFTREVTTSGLPSPDKWIQAVRGEDQLIELAGNSDPQLADAAVAALVASVGGDETTARDLARRMSNASDRSPVGLRELWSEAKRELYASKLKSAAGQYRLVVNLRNDPDTQTTYGTGLGMPRGPGRYPGGPSDSSNASVDPATIAKAPLVRSINVALIELQADGRSIRMASGTLTLSASDSSLAIEVRDPKELKGFGNSEVNGLPLEDIEGKIDLLPQPDGSWSGGAKLGDGRILQIVLNPA